MHDEGIGAEFAPHGPGSALVAAPFLVAINIERRRNSDFVIYC
jgi:hypothetical protein